MSTLIKMLTLQIGYYNVQTKTGKHKSFKNLFKQGKNKKIRWQTKFIKVLGGEVL